MVLWPEAATVITTPIVVWQQRTANTAGIQNVQKLLITSKGYNFTILLARVAKISQQRLLTSSGRKFWFFRISSFYFWVLQERGVSFRLKLFYCPAESLSFLWIAAAEHKNKNLKILRQTESKPLQDAVEDLIDKHERTETEPKKTLVDHRRTNCRLAR